MRKDVETQMMEYGLAALIWAKEKTAGALRVAARQQWDLAERYDQEAVQWIKTEMRRLAVRFYASAADARRDMANLRQRARDQRVHEQVKHKLLRFGLSETARVLMFEDLP